jgi:hypothetical protein
MKRTLRLLALTVAVLTASTSLFAAMYSVEPVPAATLLMPYFEVPYTTGNSHTVVVVGNNGSAETLAHVTLWTDRGVPTYSFDIRLPANGSKEIDLNALFISGTLPQSTAGSFGSCAATLPPANLSAANLTQLQRAHRGQSSTLLGGSCGGVDHGQATARGYITIDATRSCTTLFPGNPTYFVDGGNGIATNDNVLWGEWRTSLPESQGTPLVHIEAASANAEDYTFYRLRNGSNDDNREALPQSWRGFFNTSLTQLQPFNQTSALIWRDAGAVVPFPCGAPPAPLSMAEVLTWDDRENPYQAPGNNTYRFPLATQKVVIAPSPLVEADELRGVITYNLQTPANPTTLNYRRQSYVAHIQQGPGFTSVASLIPMESATSESSIIYIPPSPCSDGLDNDSDGKIDFPADEGCSRPGDFNETSQCSNGIDDDLDGQIDLADGQCRNLGDEDESGNPACDDGIDNDGDGLIDFGNDPQCPHPYDTTENFGVCDDGVDNDSDGLTDYPNDPGCAARDYFTESPACSDGIDNDGDGQTDYPGDTTCSSASFFAEETQCSDGISNDDDGLIDFPNDPGCETRSSTSEAPQCNDGVDNDFDGRIDTLDPGCGGRSYFTSEFTPGCSNGLDDDNDGLIDYPSETGCSSPGDNTELADCNDGEDNDCDGLTDGGDSACEGTTDLNEGTGTTRQCSDGLDNDGDGFADYPQDPGCASRYDDVEFNDSAFAVLNAEVPALSPLAMVLLGMALAGVALLALKGTSLNS